MKERLTAFTKKELIKLAQDLGVAINSRNRKDEIIDTLLSEKSEKEILKILKPSFWNEKKENIFGLSSIIGVLLTIVFFIYPSFGIKDLSIEESKVETQNISIDSISYFNSLFTCAQEIRRNYELSLELREYLSGNIKTKPIGRFSLKRTMNYLDNYYERFMENSYGEEQYIYQDALILKDVFEKYNMLENRRDFKEWNKKRDYTSDDISFLCGFLNWYIGILAKDELPLKQSYSLNWYTLKNDSFVRKNEIMSLYMKTFLFEDKPIIEYSTYLGLID